MARYFTKMPHKTKYMFMKNTIVVSVLSLTIAVFATACNNNSAAVPTGDSIRTVIDSSSMPSNMSQSNTNTNANNDTSTMLNNNMDKNSKAMDSSKTKVKK